MTTIVLWADKFAETAEFYQRLLGAEQLDSSEEFVRIANQKHEILLHRVPAQWASEIQIPPKLREDNPLKPVFEVASIEIARKAVSETHGSVFDQSTEQTYSNRKYCDGFDPEGNIFQLTCTV